MKIIENLYPISSSTRQKKRFEEMGVLFKDGFFYPNCDQLSDGSNVLEERICDCCGNHYIKKHQNNIKVFNEYNMDICQDCFENNENIKKLLNDKKIKTCLKNNGTEYPMQSEIVKNKTKNTFKNKYENGHPSRDKNVQNKKENTVFEKYGCKNPMQNDMVKYKLKKTLVETYGVSNVMFAEEIKEKQQNACKEKYGGISPFSSQMIRLKSKETLMKNGNIPTSSQQIQTYNILCSIYGNENVKINESISECFLDIVVVIDSILIDIEYDGWYWHQDKQKDRKRDEFVKSQGYKVLRIKSGHLIPRPEELKNKIDNLINSNHSYDEIILDDYNKKLIF